MGKLYDTQIETIDGDKKNLRDVEGKVLLIVNTASECGFTPQFDGLEKIYQTYKDRGLVILGFPCNQFGGQDPGTDAEILDFCTSKFSVSFPMHSKIEVNGAETHPLYVALKSSKPGLMGSERIKWNFTKFLVDRQGEVVKRYAPTTKPDKLVADIERLL